MTTQLLLGALCVLCRSGLAGAQTLTVDQDGVFRARGIEVLAFTSRYGLFGDEKIGGVQLVHHGVRTATNGDVRLSNAPEQWDAVPTMVGRDVDTVQHRVTARLAYPDRHFAYRVEVAPEARGVRVRVVLDSAVPNALVGRAGFNLEVLPSAYFGRSYLVDGAPALFPRAESGRVMRTTASGPAPLGGPTSDPAFDAAPMATATTFVLAPEDAERRLTIASRSGAISLYDGRDKAQNGWFVVRGLLPANRTGVVIDWLVTPNAIPNWVRPAVIAHSQIGYHPDAPKVAIIEQDARASAAVARLLRVDADGTEREVLRAVPNEWRRWLRYDYGRFDFSRVKEPGVYAIAYGDLRSEPFPIARDAYARMWQPSLDTYLAEQMDHVTVNDRYRVWHGASHLDDAKQAPPGPHFDLYGQGPTTDTKYAPGEHIPGLNVGGWFDAGDFDLRTQSQYAVVQTLVAVREAFGVEWDQTTVDQAKRWVDLRHPDGVPDIVQQIAHGTLALLAQYRAVGHAIPGIVEPTLAQYTHLGDAVDKTDGVPNTTDDRLAFTSKNTALDYGAIAALAAASRVLRGVDDAMATEALGIARRVWDEEHAHAPVAFRVGNTTGGRLDDEELHAAVELVIATKGEARYAERLRALLPGGWRFDASADAIVRALPYMDATFRAQVERAVRASVARADSAAKENPFGVPITRGGWAGSGAVLGAAMRGFALHRAFPDIAPVAPAMRALEFLLGTHPASSTSLVSGIGARSRTVAYGNNRADYSFIPGGIVPGVLIVPPDFPEMKEDWPFLWYEGEYVIPEAAMWIYVANAAAEVYR